MNDNKALGVGAMGDAEMLLPARRLTRKPKRTILSCGVAIRLDAEVTFAAKVEKEL
jgi:hypothetical protein